VAPQKLGKTVAGDRQLSATVRRLGPLEGQLSAAQKSAGELRPKRATGRRKVGKKCAKSGEKVEKSGQKWAKVDKKAAHLRVKDCRRQSLAAHSLRPHLVSNGAAGSWRLSAARRRPETVGRETSFIVSAAPPAPAASGRSTGAFYCLPLGSAEGGPQAKWGLPLGRRPLASGAAFCTADCPPATPRHSGGVLCWPLARHAHRLAHIGLGGESSAGASGGVLRARLELVGGSGAD